MTTKKELQLTSQYARGVRGGDNAAQDAVGRDWYRVTALQLDPPPDADQVVPTWPTCRVCGGQIDVWHESHWCMADAPWDPDGVAHVQCVELLYPTGGVR